MKAVRSMLTRLDDYYRACGIHSTDLQCQCRNGCESTAAPGPFTEAKSAFVGENYEKAPLRLVFLGLDPGEGSEWRDASQRTPEAIRRKVQCDPPGKNPHWRGTLLLAQRLLSTCDPAIKELLRDLDCRTDGEKRGRLHNTIVPMFAHANAVRCSVGKAGNKQGSSKLYSNCQQYLRGEMEVLRACPVFRYFAAR